MWTLDPAITFLNHGSFGATPQPVLALQAELRARIEAEPVRFFVRELEPRLDQVRAVMGPFLGADPDDLAFVTNASTGVSTVVASLSFGAGEQILTTSHAYPACRGALEVAAARSKAEVVVAEVPFPLRSADQVVEAVLARVTPRTKLALIDHVTSPTGLVFPVERIVPALAERGIDTLVDGAHAPGMLPLALDRLGAAYYVGNCHKWLCAPKGVGFLHARRDRQAGLLPLTISHGVSSKRGDRSRFRLAFDWTGTADPTPILCLPECLRYLSALEPGGMEGLMRANRALALEARGVLCAALQVEPPAPAEMIGSLASLPLPDRTAAPADRWPPLDPLQNALFERHSIEVPVFPWPRPPKRLIRIAAQRYNSLPQYQRLAEALRAELFA